MEHYQSGEIVLLRFPFTDAKGSKRRPALVLFDAGDADIIAARITSRDRGTDYDCEIRQWQQAGLLLPSTIRLHKVATLEKTPVERRLGRLEEDWNRAQHKMLDLWKYI